MAMRISKRQFNGEWYRDIDAFPDKAMALSYAKSLRKRGLISPAGTLQAVKARVTTEKRKYPYVVWVRGK